MLNPDPESHRRLLNQSLKSPIDNDPPSTLPNWSDRVISVDTDCELNDKTIRDLFNHLDLVTLAFTHQYTVGVLAWSRPRQTVRDKLGEDARSVRLLFESRDRLVAFDVHFYVSQTGDIAFKGLMDPKYLYFASAVRLGLEGHWRKDVFHKRAETA